MNIRPKCEQIIMKQLNSQSSLTELFLSSPGSAEITNQVLAQILNQRHHLNTTREASNSYQIHKSLAA